MTADPVATTLRQHGLRVTGQRLAVHRALAERGRHQTAEQVYERVRRDRPAISLTTVYKVLHELIDLGLAQRVVLGDGTIRFDPNTRHHAHLVCRRCGQTEDVPAGDYYAGLPAAATRGFEVQDHAVVFYGLCPVCRAGTASTAPSEATS